VRSIALQKSRLNSWRVAEKLWLESSMADQHSWYRIPPKFDCSVKNDGQCSEDFTTPERSGIQPRYKGQLVFTSRLQSSGLKLPDKEA
jgi:hypothetical protein